MSSLIRPLSSSKALVPILLLVVGWPLLEHSFVFAQITTAITHTSGVGDYGTRMTTNGNTIQITGGARSDQGSGTNLFHSFDQFNVARGDTANFLNTTPSLRTYNIISRVTGGEHSNIFGTIDTTSYPNANFFLMNPAGIVFGPTATLNVSGSIAFTTADYLRLANADGSNAGIFAADPSTIPQLSSAPITAFGFLGDNPAAITFNGSELTLDPGQSFSVIGGNITIQSATLADKAAPIAPGNRVFIGSIASRGELLAETLASAENINGELPKTLGTVHISQESNVDTSNREGGTVRIRGGQLIVDGSNIWAGSGGISFDATSISVRDHALIGTYTITTAHAGDVIFSAIKDITLDSHATVESQTFVPSMDAGSITLNATQGNVTLSNDATITSQASDGGRNTGSIAIEAQSGTVRLENSSLIFPSATQGTGRIGGVKISANHLDLINKSAIDSDNRSIHAAENIDIALTGRLSLSGNSEIETTTTEKVPAADLLIQAREVRIADGSKLSADTTPSSSGSGGTIRIRGPQGLKDSALSILIDGPKSGVFTDTRGVGAGGTIDLSTLSLTLQNGGTISASTTGTSTNATGGSIIVNATDQVTLKNGASITASSTGLGDAGNISIDAGQRLNVESSKITTEANQSKAGNINIQAIDQVRVVNGEISTSVHSGAGRGGDISIDPKTVILQDGSKVFAQAVRGSGGNITITTPLYLIDSTSRVNADSQFGLNGSVTIQSPTSNLIGTVGQLASKTNPPQVLLQNRCIALASGEQSTFILAGRDALPSEPGGWLSSPVAMEHWMGEEREKHVSRLMVRSRGLNTQPSLIMSKDETNVLSLRRLTPPGFLVRSFADRALTGCRL